MDQAGIDLFIRQQANKKSTSQISAAQLLIYENIVYHDLENRIIQAIGEDYFYEYFSAGLVSGQVEYTLPPCSATVVGAKKIISVEVKWATTDAYRSLRPMKKNTEQGMALDELGDALTQDQGFYDIKGGSIFLYPTPDNTVSNGLKMQALVNLIDLVGGEAETAIFPGHTELRDFNYLIGVGALAYVFQEWSMKDDKVMAQNDYEAGVAKMIKALTDRQSTPTEMTLPNGDRFKY